MIPKYVGTAPSILRPLVLDELAGIYWLWKQLSGKLLFKEVFYQLKKRRFSIGTE